MRSKEEQLGQLTVQMEYWKRHLNLHSWDIVLKVVSLEDLDGENQGLCSWSWIGREALISILDENEWPNKDFQQDQEKTLVHELLHCVFGSITHKDETSDDNAHQIIDDMAKLLVKLNRG